MEHVNLVITSLFTALLSPFSPLSPIWGLLAISLAAGVLLALLYGKLSNQRALKKVKRSISAGIFESVLFRHDLKTSLKAQAAMLWGGVKYFSLAIPPILVLIIPSVVVLAQLNLRYGARALQSGEVAVVTLRMKNEDALFEAEVTAPQGVDITPPLRDLDHLEVSWRIDNRRSITMASPSTSWLAISVAGASASQPLYLKSQPALLPTQLHTNPWWQFLYPGGSVPETLRAYVSSISITYPEQVMSLSGVHTNWLVLFALVSIVAGFVASRIFGIEI